MRNSELTEGGDILFADALEFTMKIRQRLRLKTPPWHQLKQERDAQILQKTFFIVIARKFGYVNKDKEE